MSWRWICGLSLVVVGCGGTEPDPGPTPTWFGDVQPLVNDHCRGCHVDGGSAPFALDSYEAVATYAEASLLAVETRTMPPWLPDPTCRTFEDQRVMTADERARFGRWVREGKPIGDASLEESYQAPSLTLEPTHSAQVPGYVSTARTSDDYRCFILDDLSLAEETFIVGSQVLPGSRQVHHVLVYALDSSQRELVEGLAAEEEREGYTCFGGPVPLDGGRGAGLVGGFPNQIAAWVPGQDPRLLDEGMAIQMAPESVVVVQVHYSALGGEPEPDRTELQLQLTSDPPDQLLRTTPVAILDLDIPAGMSGVSAERRFTNHSDEPVVVRTLTGHMHLLGTSLTATVVDENGPSCALNIPRWDFDWQQSYDTGPDAPVVIGPGASLDFACRYDNSAANQPVVNGSQIEPVDVTWGDGTLDEMCLLYIGRVEPYVPAAPASDSACAGIEACDCGDTPTTDCLLGCEAIAPGCSLCALQSASDCAVTPCGGAFLPAQECVTECFTNALMMAGTVTACMEARCPAEYEALATCVDDQLATGACAEPLATCGI